MRKIRATLETTLNQSEDVQAADQQFLWWTVSIHSRRSTGTMHQPPHITTATATFTYKGQKSDDISDPRLSRIKHLKF